MISNEQEAIELGREFLIGLGIKVLDVQRVQKMDGSIRAKFIPDLANDYWMITFNRCDDVLPDCIGETEMEREIIAAVAKDNCQITVSVEYNGLAKVV